MRSYFGCPFNNLLGWWGFSRPFHLTFCSKFHKGRKLVLQQSFSNQLVMLKSRLSANVQAVFSKYIYFTDNVYIETNFIKWVLFSVLMRTHTSNGTQHTLTERERKRKYVIKEGGRLTTNLDVWSSNTWE